MRRSLSIVCLVGLSSCTSRVAPTPEVEAQGAARPVLTANIAPMMASSRLVGTIRLTQTTDTSFTVAVDLRGGRTRSRLGWMIRTGQCGVVLPGSEIGRPEDFELIQMQTDGEAHYRMTLRIPLPDEPLRIDLGESVLRRDHVEGCGMLVRVSGG